MAHRLMTTHHAGQQPVTGPSPVSSQPTAPACCMAEANASTATALLPCRIRRRLANAFHPSWACSLQTSTRTCRLGLEGISHIERTIQAVKTHTSGLPSRSVGGWRQRLVVELPVHSAEAVPAAVGGQRCQKQQRAQQARSQLEASCLLVQTWSKQPSMWHVAVGQDWAGSQWVASPAQSN